MTAAGRTVSPVAARRTLLLLTFTRWFPVGLIVGLFTLWMLERGLSLTEMGLVFGMQGIVVLVLELPTGGLADALGRRPVLLLAGVTGVLASVLFLTAQTLAGFAAAMALQGVFRALDSGPLEAWYVDTAQRAGSDTPVELALSRAATVLGLAIASGALLSGGLVLWHPLEQQSALLLPFIVAIGLSLLHLAGTAWLVREPDRPRTGWRGVATSIAATPTVITDGLRLVGTAPVLRCLVLVEVFWSVAMIGFETLTTVRLAELLDSEERAGAVIGPVTTGAWGLFALAAWAAGLASRRIGVGWSALIARVLNGAFVVLMGVAAGPIGLVTAFLASYAMHGAAGPVHSTLLHRQAAPGNRATVLSMNSMVAGGAHSLGIVALGIVAEQTSVALAILIAGSFSMLGALLYLPAIRQERQTAASAPTGAATIGP